MVVETARVSAAARDLVSRSCARASPPTASTAALSRTHEWGKLRLDTGPR